MRNRTREIMCDDLRLWMQVKRHFGRNVRDWVYEQQRTLHRMSPQLWTADEPSTQQVSLMRNWLL